MARSQIFPADNFTRGLRGSEFTQRSRVGRDRNHGDVILAGMPPGERT